MDFHKTHKHSGLPRTSRVNEKILEYYMKFGQDRDLEKFMRLYSPSSNKSGSRSRSRCRTISNTTTASSSCGGISDDGGNFTALRKLFFLNNPECELTSDSSKSVPSSSLEQEQHGQKLEHVIPIRLEDDNQRRPKDKETLSADLDTPKKTQRSQQTQTPDSVAKTDKRLEWDSLGDVGYIKSMSTSNISILERSLLREFFQETTISTSNKATTNASDGDIHKKTQKELFMDDTRLKKKDTSDRKLHQTPLASSTLTESKQKVANKKSKSKERTREQFIQTSLARPPPQQSQAVQVNIPSETAATFSAGSSATPSSFEYCCSPWSSNENKTGHGFSVSQQHPFVSGISELQSRRRKIVNKKNVKIDERNMKDASLVNIYKLSYSLTEALNENKENVLSTPQLDLGIQLLCSLIDAKSLSHKEKKLLVRDIVKRISSLSSEASVERGINSTEGMRNSPTLTAFPTEKNKLPDSLEMHELTSSLPRTESPTEKLTQPMILESSSSHSAKSEKLIRVEVYSTGSLPTTSVQAQKALAAQKQTEKPLLPIRTSLPKKTNEINKELLIDIKSPVAAKNKSSESKLQKSSSISTRQSMSTNTTESLSKDLTTQKVAYQTNNSSEFDTTMNEWLNPMTQSEIEYDKKKRDSVAKQQNQQKQEKRKQKPKLPNGKETEREVQLNWLDTEIQRLESLKNLLLNEDISGSNNKDEVHSKKYATSDNSDVRSNESKDKLYDSVYSAPEKSSVMSTSSEHIRQEIEVIIEESNEDVINLQTNLKRTRERRRETQTVYDKPNAEREGETEFAITPTGKPVFRTIKETVTTNEEQVLPIKEQKRETQAMSAQRSKIDTPSGSNESESVCSFVQQRKHEFIEKYKNKKKSHYEALLQQQQQHQQQQQDQQQILHQHKTNASAAIAAQAGSGHYSVPNIPQRVYGFSPSAQHFPHFYTHHHMPSHCHYWHQPSATCIPPQPPPPARQCSFSASAGLTSVHSTKTNHTHSSSSIFGISSEVSIPMGSNATSSTTTTTHQYDDVAAAGVIIETSDSLVIQPSSDDIVVQTRRHSASVQVKPKSIAYVISFNTESAAKMSKTSLTSNTDEPELLTLQEHLERSKPKFCEDTKKRKAILNQIQTLRQERERELRDIVENTSLHSLDRKLMLLPPPPTKHTRVFPTKQMKAMTNKKYSGLPEVLEKRQREREERRREGNRVIRDVFNRRLQKRVRNGQLTLNHSRTVI